MNLCVKIDICNDYNLENRTMLNRELNSVLPIILSITKKALLLVVWGLSHFLIDFVFNNLIELQSVDKYVFIIFQYLFASSTLILVIVYIITNTILIIKEYVRNINGR